MRERKKLSKLRRQRWLPRQSVIAYLEFTQQFFPRSIYIYSNMMDILLIGGIRFGYRIIRDFRNPGTFNSIIYRLGNKNLMGEEISRVMIVGAG